MLVHLQLKKIQKSFLHHFGNHLQLTMGEWQCSKAPNDTSQPTSHWERMNPVGWQNGVGKNRHIAGHHDILHEWMASLNSLSGELATQLASRDWKVPSLTPDKCHLCSIRLWGCWLLHKWVQAESHKDCGGNLFPAADLIGSGKRSLATVWFQMRHCWWIT